MPKDKTDPNHHAITQTEMESAIYQPNVPKNQNRVSADNAIGVPEKEERVVEAYTLLGHVVPEKDIRAYAMSVRLNGRMFYYVLHNPMHNLYNPFGLYDESSVKITRPQGKQPFYMKEVKETTFKLYMQFLKTKNVAWLYNASREQYNG